MNRIALPAVVLIVLAFSAGQAHAKYPRNGRGIRGTVESVADRYFMFQTKQGLIKVFVSANTNFESNGRAITSDQVKAGVVARVTAHVTADGIWEAYKVNVVDAPVEDPYKK